MKIASQKIKNVSIEDIKPNPYQIRRNYNLLKLKKLASSIKEVGVLSPLLLRPFTGGYEIISGSRRLRAAIMAGLKEVPAIIIHANNRECALFSLTENIHRENLTNFEEAESLYNLLSYHGVKKDKLLKKASIDTEYLNYRLKLLRLTPKARFKAEIYSLSEETVKELLKIHDRKKQAELAERAGKEKLTPEELAFEVKNINKQAIQNKNNIRYSNIPICTNTVKKTVDILKRNGEKTEFSQNETEDYVEFAIKVRKQSVL